MMMKMMQANKTLPTRIKDSTTATTKKISFNEKNQSNLQLNDKRCFVKNKKQKEDSSIQTSFNLGKVVEVRKLESEILSIPYNTLHLNKANELL